MLRYRVREKTNSLTPVLFVANSAAYRVALCLPSTPVNDDFVTNAYANIHDCDSISTSELTNFAGDHTCYHEKVSGTIEGKTTILSALDGGNDAFGHFYPPYVSGSSYRMEWVSSSGSGPGIIKSGSRYSILAPGVLPEASVLSRINSRYFVNAVYKVIEISPMCYVYTIVYANTYNNSLGYDVYALGPSLWDDAHWYYGVVKHLSKSFYSPGDSREYLSNPEEYWNVQLTTAINTCRGLLANYSVLDCAYKYPDSIFGVHVSGISPSLAKRIAKDVHNYAHLTINSLSPPDKNVWSDLCVTAIKNCQQVDINSLAYAKDFVELRHLVRDGLSLLRGFKNPRTYLKIFLQSKYGLSLTIADTKEIVDAVRNLNSETRKWQKDYSVVRARTSDSPYTNVKSSMGFVRLFNYKIYYRPFDNGVLNCIRTLMNWDIWPTVDNDWDLIPLSFVIDWFIGVDDLCNAIDAAIYAEYLTVLSVVYSTKIVGDVSIDMSHYGIDGVRFTATRYYRTYKSQIDPPSFRLDDGSGISSHLPELNAILALKLHKRV